MKRSDLSLVYEQAYHKNKNKEKMMIKMRKKLFVYEPFRLVWFAHNSWSYMQGNRKIMVLKFWPAWKIFNEDCKKDIADGTL